MSFTGSVHSHSRDAGGAFCLQVQCERESMSALMGLPLQSREDELQGLAALCLEFAGAHHDTHAFNKAQTLLLASALIHQCAHTAYVF